MTGSHGGRHTRILAGDPIDPVELTTIDGTRIALPAADRVTHLQFRRFAGCPVCDLHLHSFVRRRAEIGQAGVREILVFHSNAADLRVHARDLPFPIVADPGKRLYARFGVEAGRRALTDPRVWPYILQGVLRSLLRVITGRQAMPPIAPEGGSLGLPADFLIGPDGILLACKYGAHAYDQWSVDELLHFHRSTGQGASADRAPAALQAVEAQLDSRNRGALRE